MCPPRVQLPTNNRRAAARQRPNHRVVAGGGSPPAAAVRGSWAVQAQGRNGTRRERGQGTGFLSERGGIRRGVAYTRAPNDPCSCAPRATVRGSCTSRGGTSVNIPPRSRTTRATRHTRNFCRSRHSCVGTLSAASLWQCLSLVFYPISAKSIASLIVGRLHHRPTCHALAVRGVPHDVGLHTALGSGRTANRH